MAAPEKPVQYRTFELDTEALPSIEAMARASNPENLEMILKAAGLTKLVKDVGPSQRARTAARSRVELSEPDYQLYANLLTSQTQLKNFGAEMPPEEVLPALVMAKESRLYDRLEALRDPDGAETLVVGIINTSTPRYFLVAQWGTRMTSVEALHKKRFRKRQYRVRRAVRSNGFRLTALGGLTLASGGATLLLLPVGWWAYFIALIVAMILCGLLAVGTGDGDGEGLVGALAALQIVIAIVVGCVRLNDMNTRPHTLEVTVCSGEQLDGMFESGEDVITTSHGKYTLQGGYYDGVYYPQSTKELALSLAHKRVRLTYHGSSGNDDGSQGPWVTGATTLGPAACG